MSTHLLLVFLLNDGETYKPEALSKLQHQFGQSDVLPEN